MLENFHDEKGEERFVVNLLGSWSRAKSFDLSLVEGFRRHEKNYNSINISTRTSHDESLLF